MMDKSEARKRQFSVGASTHWIVRKRLYNGNQLNAPR